MAASFTQKFTTSTVSADAYAGALVDREFWDARLKAVGGPGARITAFDGDGKSVDATLVQVIAKDLLPSAVTAILPGDLEIARHEIWTRTGDGADGRFTASVAGAPATVEGTMTVRQEGGVAALAVTGEVEVKIPLFGGRIEKLIIEQLQELITAEHGFATQWLEKRAN